MGVAEWFGHALTARRRRAVTIVKRDTAPGATRCDFRC